MHLYMVTLGNHPVEWIEAKSERAAKKRVFEVTDAVKFENPVLDIVEVW